AAGASGGAFIVRSRGTRAIRATHAIRASRGLGQGAGGTLQNGAVASACPSNREFLESLPPPVQRLVRRPGLSMRARTTRQSPQSKTPTFPSKIGGEPV